MKHGHPIEKALTMSLTEIRTIQIPAPVAVKDSEHWTDLAACKGRTALFFPPKAERPQARARRPGAPGSARAEGSLSCLVTLRS